MKCVRWSVSLLGEETRMRGRGRIGRGSQREKNGEFLGRRDSINKVG